MSSLSRASRRHEQDAEKVAFLTRPTPARRDAPFTKRRSRVAQRLNVPRRTPPSSLTAALLDSLFEHPETILTSTPFGRFQRYCVHKLSFSAAY
jgi:hypothetical protein